MPKDILSRREFLKNSLKKVLPFITGIVVLNKPNILLHRWHSKQT